jgi:flagellar biosynthesis/type III secretory pathway protein FliH
MIPAKQLLNEIVSSLRNVIAPAIAEPFPKAQAYMAAVILEFVSRQVEERSDIAEGKQEALAAMFRDLSRLAGADRLVEGGPASEAELSQLIERLYAERSQIGEEAFSAANRLVRQTLRQLLDQELKVAGKAEA